MPHKDRKKKGKREGREGKEENLKSIPLNKVLQI